VDDETTPTAAEPAAAEAHPATSKGGGSSRQRWLTLAKIAVAVVLIGVLAQRGALDTETLLGVLARPLTLGPVTALAFLAISLSALRWQLLLQGEGIQIGMGQAFRLTWIGHFFNMVFPGAVSGDAVKMYYVGFLAPERKEEAWTTVFADRVIGLLALVSVATVAALLNVEFMWSRPPLQATLLTMVAILSCALVGGLSLALGLWDRVTGAAWFESLPGSGLFRRAQLVLSRLSRKPGLLLATFLISFGAHWIAVTNGYLIGQVARDVAAELALGVPEEPNEVTPPPEDAAPDGPTRELGYVDYCTLFPVALFTNAIPLTPGGIGVGENVLGQLFVWAGGAKKDGVSVMLLYRVLFYALALFGALLYMAYKRDPPDVVPAPSPVGPSA
jgi:uncharacterized membrane protein YbhN (UPF0104 family)